MRVKAPEGRSLRAPAKSVAANVAQKPKVPPDIVNHSASEGATSESAGSSCHLTCYSRSSELRERIPHGCSNVAKRSRQACALLPGLPTAHLVSNRSFAEQAYPRVPMPKLREGHLGRVGQARAGYPPAISLEGSSWHLVGMYFGWPRAGWIGERRRLFMLSQFVRSNSKLIRARITGPASSRTSTAIGPG
jgi:hypothetical protein